MLTIQMPGGTDLIITSYIYYIPTIKMTRLADNIDYVNTLEKLIKTVSVNIISYTQKVSCNKDKLPVSDNTHGTHFMFSRKLPWLYTNKQASE